jgi:protein-tyrosine-phosphatase/Cu/Ag efflux protein CusF
MSHLSRNSSVRISLAAGLALLASAFPPPAFAAGSGDGNGKTTVVFVCLHGSVKSQMAAAHFNRIAGERGLPFTAISRGIEVDTSIPTRIRDALNLDGLAPTDDIPIGLTADVAGRATKVVAFDAVPEERRGTSEVTYWSDVPPATKDYAAARDVIVRHIDALVPTLVSTAPVNATFRGVVASVDERNDSISIRLQSSATGETTEDFKVQDGLIFNAVRFGDAVAFTVETIKGEKTIKSLTKE